MVQPRKPPPAPSLSTRRQDRARTKQDFELAVELAKVA
jgi:hypothetical protein